jgi:hypothetical protein
MADEVAGDSEQVEVDLFADEGESTPTPEAPTEETKTEDAKEEDKGPVASVEDPEAEDKPTEGEPEAPEGDAPKPRTAEARKEQLNSEIRELVSRRNDARREIEAVNAQVYQPQTADELIEAGSEPAMARVEALEQRTQMAEYNAQVADLNANLGVESLQVLNDFPVFDPNSPEYDKALATRAAKVYQRAAGLQTDPQTGLFTQANAMPYEIFKAFAETHQTSVQSGQVNGQRAAEKMLASADTPPSAAPKAPKVDPLMELWKD